MLATVHNTKTSHFQKLYELHVCKEKQTMEGNYQCGYMMEKQDFQQLAKS